MSGKISHEEIYNKILNQFLERIQTGGIIVMNNDGLVVAEQRLGLSSECSDPLLASANRLFYAGEKTMNEFQQNNFLSQIFESEGFYLMLGKVKRQFNYAILSAKINGVSLGMLKLMAQKLEDTLLKVAMKLY